MEENRTSEQMVSLKIPLAKNNLREELNFYKELRSYFKEYDKPVEEIDFIISNIESSLLVFGSGSEILLDEEKIIKQIEKHPYFKNPCDYPIRLITILKYLKSKGFNMNYTDIDLYVDRLIQRMEGVKKVGRGQYQKRSI